jgi:hypothetical protein
MTYKGKNMIKSLLSIGLIASLFALSSLLIADEQKKVEAPVVEQCVESTDIMRRNHMELIKHQRVATMRQGIRTDKHSLVGCINCHAKKDESGKYMDVKNPEHFCRSCHTYAAVSIDCFQCHTSLPEEGKAHE